MHGKDLREVAPIRGNGIDYSKWDHLDCSSASEEEEGEQFEYDDSMVVIDDEQDTEIESVSHPAGEHDIENDDLRGAHDKCAGDDIKDEGDIPGFAKFQDRLTEVGAKNQEVLLEFQDWSGLAVQDCFENAVNLTPSSQSIIQALAEQNQQCQSQCSSFRHQWPATRDTGDRIRPWQLSQAHAPHSMLAG